MFLKKYLKIKKYIFLLFFLYSNQILLSSELIQKGTQNIKYESDLNLANNTQEKIESVTATGFGTSLEKASQNAATNALTQVVGSFIDAETIVKEQTNINNGIVEQTSMIREDISDYSQGSIKYFEVLDIKENGSLYQVTARVDVKIEDFTAYIKKLAFGSAKIEKDQVINYFAKAAAELENKSNVISIIKKIYEPLYSGEVYEVKIDKTKFQPLSNWQSNSKYCLQSNISSACDPNGIYKKWDKNRTFIIPFSISLKEDYKKNLFNKLDNISSKKIVQSNVREYQTANSRAETQHWNNPKKGFDFTNVYIKQFNRENDYNISVIDFEKNKKFIYIMKDAFLTYKREIAKERKIDFINFKTDSLLKYYFYAPGADANSGLCTSNKFYNLQFDLLDKDNNTLKSKIISPVCSQHSTYPFSIWWKPSIVRYSAINNYREDSYTPTFSLLNSDEGYLNRVDRVIFTKKEYYFVMEIDLEILSKMDEINIRFIEY